ncbi:DUF5004 domain-containing protein [Flagellimonas amoyensis]|uniref:DUF5004 domain-containing protein n=1 Tax=Flagellimonas amoyensis TaxID=2169401 RepID=UPI000D3A4F99|nr:DUF5004 domain-containing protein [Allomuricauda amoyensis]
MKRNAFIIGVMLLMGGIISSCNSDNEVDCPEDFTGELTTAEEDLVGTWVLSAIVADEEIDLTDDDVDNPSTDFFAQYPACQKDASYTFNSDRSYEYGQGQNATDCQNKATLEGTWKYASANLSLVSACSLQNTDIEFNVNQTAFSFTNDFEVRDVDGVVSAVEITFVYSLAIAD